MRVGLLGCGDIAEQYVRGLAQSSAAFQLRSAKTTKEMVMNASATPNGVREREIERS